MKHKIKFVIGDYGGDGHDKRKSFLIESNFSSKKIKKAYDEAAKLLEFDFLKEVAHKYGNQTILKEHFEKIRAFGFLDYEDLEEDGEESRYSFCYDKDTYFDLYLNFIKIGNKDFEWKFIDDEFESIYAGGYGLFS